MTVTTPSKRMASLAVINYEALANNDPAEIQKLVQACQTTGMFYLDLRGPRTQTIVEDVPALFRTGQHFFNLPQDSPEKIESLREGMERGYHVGKGFEYYEIPRDSYHLSDWSLPATFIPQATPITRTITTFHTAIQTILTHLSTSLHLPPSTIPELTSLPGTPSDTALKLVYKPPIHDAGTVIHPWHTDFGLATLLWYDEETTQVPAYDESGRQTGEPLTVPVVEGAVLVNVADELAGRSGGVLRSTVHRVVAPPGEKRVRNGVIYLVRPDKV
ncbi:oxidoreductase [Aspergillus heteromorphus CBS 117.55]|uniref:Oxidoreductase n=1 Tax=Aspergillus heteromorphus CBS 117.55 TaxID=1448321 RepID=A0A317WMJ8_9EURO|nr:oxidoreductase [Aspergillus heteromorphus CBS 117.55]PWY86277.1 oxidoreductase [Aspergillus heteromorphus CBS 117.55]